MNVVDLLPGTLYRSKSDRRLFLLLSVRWDYETVMSRKGRCFASWLTGTELMSRVFFRGDVLLLTQVST